MTRRVIQSQFSARNQGGLLESMFREAMVENAAPPQRRFIAVAETPTETIGIRQARPVECIHLIMGTMNFDSSFESVESATAEQDGEDKP
ncbi:MAG: hypothetical protein R3C05_24000 [Pirellulaceae bacterium]